MTSSTKPEVHNVSQRRQRKTGPRPQATCEKFGVAVWFSSYANEKTKRRTNKQTNTLITVLRTPPGGKVTNGTNGI